MNRKPKHVAIIMDGNGRWAKQRLLPRIAGHRAGAKAVRAAIEFAVKEKLDVLSLFALSCDNANQRPQKEIGLLMGLFLDSLKKNRKELFDNNVRLRVIGDRSIFSEELQGEITNAESLMAGNSGMELVVAINYSGRWDILQATQQCLTAQKNNALSSESLTEAQFASYLSIAGLPDPDLIVRTSGEQRISNFFLWQAAYSEIYLNKIYWPDFRAETFADALEFYANRKRRFGKTDEQLEQAHA